MSYFEKEKLTDSVGNVINPATEDSITMLKRIFTLLKPLGQITGSGSNRLSIDINNAANATLGTVTGVTTVTTVTTVGTVTNQSQMGGIAAFEMMKELSRSAYNTGIRSRLS